MRSIQLRFTSNRGDELGRMPLPDVHVAAAGESGGRASVSPQRQVPELCDRIRRAAEGEGMTIALDELDLQITVSRGLLAPGNHDDVQISLPVRTSKADGGNGNTGGRTEDPQNTGTAIADLDDLFNLDGLLNGR